MFDFFLFSKVKSDLWATVPASTEAGFDRRGIRSVDLVRRAFDGSVHQSKSRCPTASLGRKGTSRRAKGREVAWFCFSPQSAKVWTIHPLSLGVSSKRSQKVTTGIPGWSSQAFISTFNFDP